MHVGDSRLVDVHHHFVPPFYLTDNRKPHLNLGFQGWET